MRWSLLSLLLLHGLFAQAPPARIATVTSAAGLAAALAVSANDVIELVLPVRSLSDEQAAALRRWVEAGGTLATATDVAGLFGIRYVAAEAGEQRVHGRRAMPVDALPVVTGVRDVWLTLPAGGVFLTSHPTALPLLTVADPPGGWPSPRVAAALLYWGRGQVLVSGGVPSQARGQGAVWLAGLAQLPNRLQDLAHLPIETLTVAQQRLAEARRRFAREPEAATALLNQAFLAFRLWYGDELTARGETDPATSVLAGVAQALPEDPAVYLAVARLNDALGRSVPAAEARATAAARYRALKREPPGPEAPQVRVDWSLFAEAVNAVGRAWTTPAQPALDEAAARAAQLLALDHYRRGRLEPAAALANEAAAAFPGWAPARHLLGLIALTRGETLTRASRDRATDYAAATAALEQAARARPSADYPPSEATRAADWAATAGALAAAVALEPPDVEVRDGVILRLNNADRRLQIGPLRESLLAAWSEAARKVRSWGVQPSDVEVLVFDTTLAMQAAIPPDGAAPQTFSRVAVTGRRALGVADSKDLFRLARYALAHIMINALTEGGLPPPLWFAEGLAWGAQERATELQQAQTDLRRGRLFNIPQLNDPEVFYDRGRTDRARGQAHLMLTALVNRVGQQVLVDLPAATGWGENPDAALQRLCGLNQDQFLTALIQGRLNDPQMRRPR